MKKIVIMGSGTVGSGVFELIEKNVKRVWQKFGETLSVEKILVRNVDKYSKLQHGHLFTNEFSELMNSKPDIMIEAIGGIEPAYTYIKESLENGIHVITANKELVSEYGKELIELANKNNVLFRFEASVGGGIPILKPLEECFEGNQINSIVAIINGTTNYILTKMHEEGKSYKEALGEAQVMGFAESDPTADVMGLDAARKLAILSEIAFEKRIKWEDIETQGITELELDDIDIAKKINGKFKLIAKSENSEDDIYASVRMSLIDNTNLLSRIDNENNAVIVTGDAVGNVMFSGKGAGKFPTASAVMADLIEILKEKESFVPKSKKLNVKVSNRYSNKVDWLVKFLGSNVWNKLTSGSSDFLNAYELIETGYKNKEYIIFKSLTETDLVQKIESISLSGEEQSYYYFPMIS